MLPQARLRFVLADDPGAGKTIMAGLLIKELDSEASPTRPRPCPAPLDVQWQDELSEKFDETSRSSTRDASNGSSAATRGSSHDRCIAVDRLRETGRVMPDLLRADWDLVVIDEAHKCIGSHTLGPPGAAREARPDTPLRTRRGALASHRAARSSRPPRRTRATRTRFQNFLKLLDPDQFSDQRSRRRADRPRRQPVLPPPSERGPRGRARRHALCPPQGPEPAICSKRSRADALRGGHRVHPRVPRSSGRSTRHSGRARADGSSAPARVKPRRDPLLAS